MQKTHCQDIRLVRMVAHAGWPPATFRLSGQLKPRRSLRAAGWGHRVRLVMGPFSHGARAPPRKKAGEGGVSGPDRR